MPSTKISTLTVLSDPAAGDLIPIVDVSDLTMAASGTTKRVTQGVLSSSILASAQPLDANLTALAGVTLAANTFPARSSSGILAAKPITDFGLSLIDDADASNARTTLGLGTLATQSGTFSGPSSGTNTGDQTITLTGDVTGSGTGSFVTSIANDSITLAKVAHMATASLLGRNTAGIGTVEVLSASTARSLLGLGTIATQDASSVAITGGTINGATVGATTAATGAFTSLSATGITTVSSGTALLPSIVSTTGTADTGLWFPAADTLAASTAGVERVRISSTGNVGIGATSPGYKLDVNGTGRVSGVLTANDFATTTGTFQFTSPYAGTLNLTSQQAGQKANISATSPGGKALTMSSADALATIATMPGVPLAISTANTERIRIDTAGNVGIGTTSPSAKLQIDGIAGSDPVLFRVKNGTYSGSVRLEADPAGNASVALTLQDYTAIVKYAIQVSNGGYLECRNTTNTLVFGESAAGFTIRGFTISNAGVVTAGTVPAALVTGLTDLEAIYNSMLN